MKKYIKITFSVLLSFSLLTSCDDLLEIEPEEVLLAVDYLGDDETEARSALFGVLSQMQDIVGQYIVLGEMRADLVNVNASTEDEIRQINNLEISEDNSYIDPTTLFSIINNCNFALVGIDTEAYENRLLEDYASLLRIRTWAQLQILINYGKLPYIDKPIRSDENFKEEFELLDFNQGLDQLIRNLIPISEIENVSRHDNGIFNMIPDNDVLLGDLYLWRGDYIGAAVSYKKFLDNDLNILPEYLLDGSYDVVIAEDATYDYTATSGWWALFTESIRLDEVINYIPFDEQYRQANTAYDIVTNQFQASNSIIDNWLEQSWGFLGTPVASNDLAVAGDTRRFSSTNIYTGEILKYQEEYFVWNRAAKIYLRYAEAINYAGYPEYALIALNGIFNNPDVAPQNSIILDETNPNSFLIFEADQYYTLDNSLIPTSGHLGVRGRVGLAPETITDGLTESEAIQEVGKFILNEAALELAFEGNRWEDLVRFSRRAGNENIIGDAIANKFELDGDAGRAASVKGMLTNPDNWFLPLEVPSNFVTKE